MVTDHKFPSLFHPNFPLWFCFLDPVRTRNLSSHFLPGRVLLQHHPPAEDLVSDAALPHPLSPPTALQLRVSRAHLRTPLPPDCTCVLVSPRRLKCQKANTYDVEQFERMSMSAVRSSDGKDNASQDSQNGTSPVWNDAHVCSHAKKTEHPPNVFDTWMVNMFSEQY